MENLKSLIQNNDALWSDETVWEVIDILKNLEDGLRKATTLLFEKKIQWIKFY